MTNEKELQIGEVFPINEKLAGIVPMATPAEQKALTANIMENGLNEPVVLWLNEIVDGRCRQLACKLAGVAVRAIELGDELTEEEVVRWVKGANTRRNLTMAQKIMVASKESMKEGSNTLSDIAKSWAISRRILAMANYISKARPEFVEPLLNGLTVPIINAKGKHTQTNKITAIHAYIKREEENVTEVPSHEWSANDNIYTQAGRDWFYEFIKETGTTNVKVMMELVVRANDKFKDDNTVIPHSHVVKLVNA
ncbi:MAG: ParB-like chromosome segregation protein Spo0J [Colwellia sp.]|jgi:ParB-like chromosome segregation protein Spo0J